MFDSKRYRYGFDTWDIPRRTPEQVLASFATECRHASPETLTQWLAECPTSDPAYAVIQAELDVRQSLTREDNLSAFAGGPIYATPDVWDMDDPDWIPSGGLL